MTKKLILIRGLPGSGKTWTTEAIANNFKYETPNYFDDIVILSTDDLWYGRISSHYLWNPTAIGAAHKVNQAKCCQAMVIEVPFIIIDNTNISQQEMQPYIDLAHRFDYEIEVKESQSDWRMDVNKCFEKCTHGVPLETIQRMKDRWIESDQIDLGGIGCSEENRDEH